MPKHSPIKEMSIFATLEDHELELLKSKAVIQKYPSKDNIIFHAGDESRDLYIVKSGRVNAVRYNNEHDQKIIVNTFGPGEFFGELSVLDGDPRSATIETVEPTVLLKITLSDLKSVLMNHPEINFQLTKIVVGKLRQATNQIEELVLYDVYKRTARLIDKLTGHNGPGSELDKITHHQLSELIGASREMVSRSISKLKKRGYIHIDKKRIKVLKKLPIR